jgi:hypothetical protein
LSSDFFRKSFTLIATGSSIQNIFDTMVKPTFVHVYTNISIENLSSSYTELRVGVCSCGDFHNYLEHDDPQANFLYWVGREILIHEHERLQLQLTGLSTNDVIKLFLQGYFIEEINAGNRRPSNSGSGDGSEANHNDNRFAVN